MITIGIAGAGLLGRLLAWRLSSLSDCSIDVFDPAPGPAPSFDGTGAAGFTAAGMLSPIAELDHASPQVSALGWRSLPLWRDFAAHVRQSAAARRVEHLPESMFVQRGSLMLAHRTDLPSATRILARITHACQHVSLRPSTSAPRPVQMEELKALESDIHDVAHAWFLEGEGHIDTPVAMAALHAAATAQHVRWHWGMAVGEVAAGRLRTARGESHRFDHVFDVRGVGARPDMPVRGVRGETVWLHAPGHRLSRPVRLLHPRHRVYLVPRSGSVILLGASEIESEDRSPVSVRTAVELMSAAQGIMPSLAQARVIRLDRNLRPALPDNLPAIETSPGLTRINGLFRHGWLVGPALAEDALEAAGIFANPSVRPLQRQGGS